ncbi:STAS domain-containing protein [Dactylosporangium sp. NPDC050688]|uniref:STAS domain-containing protein n=1 Tax=Dactylosporangium sp. NPDC050688 TaxID=3157217 RepID=UPI00340A2063
MTRPDPAAPRGASRLLRFDAVIDKPHDIGHLALYFAILSGSPGRRRVHLRVDVARCDVLAAADIDLLVELHRRLREHGGRLTLRKPPARMQHLLQRADPAALSEMLHDGDGASAVI